jgi:hypothetical protein
MMQRMSDSSGKIQDAPLGKLYALDGAANAARDGLENRTDVFASPLR